MNQTALPENHPAPLEANLAPLPQEMPPLKPWLLSKAHAKRLTPALWNIEQCIREISDPSEVRANGCSAVVMASDLDGLIELPDHKKYALVFFFADGFEPYLAELIENYPFAIASQTRDGLHSFPVYSWRTTTKHGFKIEVRLPGSAIDDVTSDHYLIYEADQCQPPVHSVPVIMAAGNTVAVGGFWCDETFGAGASGIGACTGFNYKPYRIWDDKVLAEAAERAKLFGNFPPIGRWTNWDNEFSLFLPYYSFRVKERD